MAKPARDWKKYEDVNTYVRDLEDVYGLTVEMHFTPKPSQAGELYSEVEIVAWWNDSNQDGNPDITYKGLVQRTPMAAFISNMTRALIDFTYLCVEAHIQALSRLN